MVLLVTSASGANGSGYGKLLAFGADGEALGPFSDDVRIVDPRGLGSDGLLLFVNSGSDRILALDDNGRVVRETGVIPWLNPGGGNFGPDGRYHVGMRAARTIMAFAPTLDGAAEAVLPSSVVPFPRGFAFGPDSTLFSRPASARAAKATTPFWPSIRSERSSLPGMSRIRTSVRWISRSRRTETCSSAANIPSVLRTR
jgi:hypothetical protein